MTVLGTIILGIIEGITEFLPISSTFHLIFTARFLEIEQTDFAKLFEVFIQSGAILALLILYFRDLIRDITLIKKVLISFLPTAIVGALLYKIIKNIFFSTSVLMIATFIVIGFLFLLVEFLIYKNQIRLERNLSQLSDKQAFLIGFLQSFSVIFGVSRAGIVIITMMALGFKRTQAAYYSFFLSIPTIFAASFFDLFKSREILSSTQNNILLLTIGFFCAFTSAYFTLRWFISFLQKNTLVWFGIYRIVIGAILGIAV